MRDTAGMFTPIQPVIYAWAQGYKAFKHEILRGQNSFAAFRIVYDKCPFTCRDDAKRAAYLDGRKVAYMDITGNSVTECPIAKRQLRLLV